MKRIHMTRLVRMGGWAMLALMLVTGAVVGTSLTAPKAHADSLPISEQAQVFDSQHNCEFGVVFQQNPTYPDTISAGANGGSPSDPDSCTTVYGGSYQVLSQIQCLQNSSDPNSDTNSPVNYSAVGGGSANILSVVHVYQSCEARYRIKGPGDATGTWGDEYQGYWSNPATGGSGFDGLFLNAGVTDSF